MTNRVNSYPEFSLTGSLLVATPSQPNALFAQTVCLIVHHSPLGAVGIFLNQSLQSDAAGLWQHLSNDVQPVNNVLHFGGPHSGPVVALHNAERYAEFQTADGVYFAAQVQNLQALINASQGSNEQAETLDVKLIVGQADWKAGQLDQELARGHWLPLPVSPDVVFADDRVMWHRAMRQFGNRYISFVTGAVPPASILAN